MWVCADCVTAGLAAAVRSVQTIVSDFASAVALYHEDKTPRDALVSLSWSSQPHVAALIILIFRDIGLGSTEERGHEGRQCISGPDSRQQQ